MIYLHSNAPDLTCVILKMAAASEDGCVFDCPICLERLQIPKYLPCLHTFCELCIQSFIGSSISGRHQRKKSVLCPVCRLQIDPPFVNISAEEWAKALPLNHQLLSLVDAFPVAKTNVESGVQCDSCRRDNDQNIAKFRCIQCKDNLCEACCKFIHKRIKQYSSHDIVDLYAQEECLFHREKRLEFYCFDHEKLCCSVCRHTQHEECDTMTSLDAMSRNEIIEPLTKILMSKTQNLKYFTEEAIQKTEKNIKELHDQKDEILKDVAGMIQKKKDHLDDLHSQLQRSFKAAHGDQITNLSSLVQALKKFDTALEDGREIVSAMSQEGSERQIFLTNEKVKIQISDHMDKLKKQTKPKRTKLTWQYLDEMQKMSNLKKLGDYEYKSEEVDWISRMERDFQEIGKGHSLHCIYCF